MRIKKVSQSIPIKAKVVNSYSESEEETYSCDYINTETDTKLNKKQDKLTAGTGIEITETNIINNLNANYSTDEIRIGTWIDGKPLYRKVFSGTVNNIVSLCNAQSKTAITNMYGYALASNGVYMPMNNSFDDRTFAWSAWWASTAVAATFDSKYSSSSSVIIVLEYTKD